MKNIEVEKHYLHKATPQKHMSIANGTPAKIAKTVTFDRPTFSSCMIRTEVHAAMLNPQNSR